jgi:hypothetical protein
MNVCKALRGPAAFGGVDPKRTQPAASDHLPTGVQP